jgi:hypothetical protein
MYLQQDAVLGGEAPVVMLLLDQRAVLLVQLQEASLCVGVGECVCVCALCVCVCVCAHL